MADILQDISTFVSFAIDWISDFANVIADTPLLLIFVITSFVGLAVGLIKRLISL